MLLDPLNGKRSDPVMATGSTGAPVFNASSPTPAFASVSAPVTLRADGRATHQSVVTAMDVLGKLGFTEINIATVSDAGAATP